MFLKKLLYLTAQPPCRFGFKFNFIMEKFLAFCQSHRFSLSGKSLSLHFFFNCLRQRINKNRTDFFAIFYCDCIIKIIFAGILRIKNKRQTILNLFESHLFIFVFSILNVVTISPSGNKVRTFKPV